MNDQPDTQAAFEHAKAVKDAHLHELLSKPNVVGCGVGFRQVGGARTDQVALVVMVRSKVPSAQLAQHERIPSELEGVPVDVQEVGEIGVL
ncbi:MAG: hypothetical protein ACK2UW_01335 [Anaerolineales bacterium]